MSEKIKNTTDTSNREMLVTREFDAPRKLVFDAWTEPEKIGQWWGPDGFTTTTFEMDFRPGGTWKFIMHGPDGTDYDNRIVYTEIKRPELIKYDHYGHLDKDGDPPHFKSTILFDEVEDKTKITMRALFPTKEARDKTVEFGAIEGANQTLSRLAQFLNN